MSLVKVSKILKDAEENSYGVAAFNIFNYETIAWVIETAEEEGKPVLIQFYPGFKDYISFKVVTGIVKELSAKVKVPIGLHLDHSFSYDEIVQGIKDGFPSVMIDASKEEYRENVEQTSKVVEYAHKEGIDVEAELGHVGSGANKEDFKSRDFFTGVDEAVRFIEETGADSLAVSIGNAHGYYAEKPELDFELLTDIKENTDIPLVLHGGSGIPDKQLKEAARIGISKFNIATEYFKTFYDEVNKHTANLEEGNYFETMNQVKSGVKEFIKYKMRLLNP